MEPGVRTARSQQDMGQRGQFLVKLSNGDWAWGWG